MLITKVAKRYAAALFQIADEKKQLDTILADIRLINKTISGSRELLLFLRNKIIKEEKKKAVLTEIFGNKVSDLTMDFLKLLVDKKREEHLPAVTNAYIRTYNIKAGIVEVQLAYAYEPENNQVSKLTKELESYTGKKIILHQIKDASLRGGLKVTIEDTVIDGSVKNKVAQLEALFSGTAV